jgi:histidinol-phosphate aminotransferase
MARDYTRPDEVRTGLRLHLNENTGGCPPEVLDALRRLTAEDVSFYPDYDELVARTAAHLGVAPDWLLLTNGLDEGILAAAVAYLRPRVGADAEALIVEPAFEMYTVSSGAVGARVVTVDPAEDFAFPIDEVLRRVSPRTGVVFVASPNNPTGQLIPHDALRAIAAALPAGAILFLDEAYADFSGDSFLDELPEHPNVVIGRTFAKAYGLAALRIGAVIGHPGTLLPMRRVVPPYSINAAAAAALRAAIASPDYVGRYVAESAASRQLLYDACDRLGRQYWRSAGNFVLIRFGDEAAAIVRELQARGIVVRNRSHQPGCDGCVRITAGLVEHTRACIAALEEVSCGAR